MKELSLAKQEYLHPPVWSKRLALGKLVISMSIKTNQLLEQPAPLCVYNRLQRLRQERGVARQDLSQISFFFAGQDTIPEPGPWLSGPANRGVFFGAFLLSLFLMISALPMSLLACKGKD